MTKQTGKIKKKIQEKLILWISQKKNLTQGFSHQAIKDILEKFNFNNPDGKLVDFAFYYYRKTPLLVPGVDQFSNSNSFVLDQLVAKTRTYLKTWNWIPY